MKEGWEYIALSSVCKVQNGFAFNSKLFNESNNGFPLIRIRDIKRGYSLTYTDETCSDEFFVEDGDMLIGMDGDFNIGEWKGGHALLNQRVCKLIPSEKILSKFIFYFIPEALQKINDKTAFSTVKHLSSKQVNAILLPKIPISEQQSIVDYLDSAFAKIDAMKANAEKALNEAKALFQASLKEMLEPKEGWEENTINDIAFFRNGVAHEKDIEKGGNYIVINSKFVATEGTIRKYTNEQLSPLYTNEIVMVMSDVPKGKTLAKCYIIECDNKYSLNQRICAFKSKGLDVRFLYYLLNRNPNLLKYDNGENQTNLRKNQILECPVAYPAQKNEQQSIVDTLDSLKSKVDRLQANYDKISQECDALKQAILRQVFE